MGQLAAALGVVPGTATTMVKTLAESGLVKYEPYAGVRLTASGEKLAALVVRRHRLIELFLVKVMGMSWTEVHDEAEHLEHAVSDRLIDRIDEMLGRPAVDPHGDPIPDPDGVLERRPLDSLLTCPLREPVTISRVTDQDPEFLRFIERRDLKPGARVEVEERDTAADSVRLRGKDDRIVHDRRARGVEGAGDRGDARSSRCCGSPARPSRRRRRRRRPPGRTPRGRSPTTRSSSRKPSTRTRRSSRTSSGSRSVNGDWQATFTQEWPAPGLRHQLSYTLVGGVARPAHRLRRRLPELSLPGARGRAGTSGLLAAGERDRSDRAITSIGSDHDGLQVNLPFSKQHGDFYLHWNAGFTWLPRGRESHDLVSPFLAGSVIYRAAADAEPDAGVGAGIRRGRYARPARVGLHAGRSRLSPGVRGGWNVGERRAGDHRRGGAGHLDRRRVLGRRVRLFLLRAAVQRR